MSLRYEQYASLLLTKQLLRDLLHHSTRPKKASDLVARASCCLRHFPALGEDGTPYFSKDNFGPSFIRARKDKPDES